MKYIIFVCLFASFIVGCSSSPKTEGVVDTNRADHDDNLSDSITDIQDHLSIAQNESEPSHELKAEIDIKYLANMMLEEKNAHQLNDAPYVAYLVDSLGFTKKENGEEFVGGGMHLYLSSIFNNERSFSRRIRIEGGRPDPWFHFIRLKEFGLRGPGVVARGKGLEAMAGRNYLEIGYDPSNSIE